MKPLKHVFLFLFLSLAAAPSFAMDLMAGKIAINAPWARALPAVSVNGAAYMTFHNMGDEDDRLVSASTSIADMTQIHNHISVDGLMKMVHIPEGLEIPAGAMVELKPHGLHVMFMGLIEPLDENSSFQLKLNFEKAGEIEIMVPVMREAPDGMHMKHDSTAE